ncbi:MAG: hypothetical protein WDN48_17665 [Pseudolabrys sp.]
MTIITFGNASAALFLQSERCYRRTVAENNTFVQTVPEAADILSLDSRSDFVLR